ncbi:polymorphic toxin-type HINT domain-containing protein, partial [Streptomyces sp. NPDC004533]|uniref:polymorphic toxin-type HINT domain-containing protein n=1 Tax=Streptomyces sp. NPDC004533 TaxID=3154278 RepID=UPI0033BA2192
QYDGESSAAAANARAAAAQARRQAAEANRAAGEAESLARKAATAAADARDAARSAAAHAKKAADAANDAAKHAGEANSAAQRSTEHANAATEAANAASKAAQQAQTVYTLARQVESAELLTRTNAGIENARDLKAQEDAQEAQRKQEADDADQRRRTADDLAQKAQGGTSDEEIARLGRQLALADAKDGKPWIRAAAQTALGADTAGVVAYVRTGRTDAQQQDDRTDVERLAEENAVKEVRDGAEQALKGDAATVGAFLHEGQYQVGSEAFRVAIAQAADAAGPIVKERARKALDAGTTDSYRTFLTDTLAKAQVEDDRVKAAQLADSGTPEVKSAARIALEGPSYLLRQFVESGQYTAQRKDMLSLTHQQQVQQLVAQAAEVAAKAQQNAAKAQVTAAKARKAATEADKWATKARQSESQAADYAKEADQHAKDAEASARQAADSARTARAAADRADQSAHDAAVSAGDATMSAEMAQNSASSAWTAAAEAKASADRAGKSAADAMQAAAEAFTTAVKKYREEEEQRRREAVAKKEAAEKDPGQRAAALYRCGIVGCEAAENPGRWCQHHEAYCDVLSRAPELEALAKAANGFINDITGLTQLENCAQKGDLEACWQLGRDMAVSSKFRMIGIAYKTLMRLQRGCGECFLAGTRVLMADGSQKPIEKLRAGDLVRATDPLTGETGARHVTRQIVTKDDKHFAAVTVRGPTGGRSPITATYDHPFWSVNLRAWVPAEDLLPGDSLRTDSGATATVVANHAFDRQAVTYSLTVEGLHTFYVLAGKTPLLVHNSECKPLVLGLKKYIDDATTQQKGYNLMDKSLEEEIGKLPDGTPFTKWMSGVKDALRSNKQVWVNLKGFSPIEGTWQEKFDTSVARGRTMDRSATDWEMAQIEYHYRVGDLEWKNVHFLDEDGKEVKLDPPKPPEKKK